MGLRMDKVRSLAATLLSTALVLFYLYDRPLFDRLLGPLLPVVAVLGGIGIVYFGFTIIRDNKRLAEDHLESFGKGWFQRVSGLQYRESPLRLTITLAGVCMIGIGVFFLTTLSSSATNAMFGGFIGVVSISAIATVIGSGAVAIIAALFLLKSR